MAGQINEKERVAQGEMGEAHFEGDKYSVQEVGAESEPIHDSGEGKEVIIRTFEFRYPPGQKGKPTKEQILTPEYIKHLEIRLWADELEMIMNPRVTFHKKGFRVFATCQAKKGSLILSRPDLLQNILNDTGRNRK